MSDRILVLTDNIRGHQQMAIALAEAIALERRMTFDTQIVNFSLQARLFGLYPKTAYFAHEYALIISVGSKTGGYALHINQQINAKLVHILSTGLMTNNNKFAYIIRPSHDRAKYASNLLEIFGSLSPWSAEKLAQASARFAPIFDKSIPPRIGFLIGGDSHHGKYSEADAQNLKKSINILHGMGYSICVTTSRRTPNFIKKILGNTLDSMPRAYGYFGIGENPYGAILAYCDVLVASADSISMISEAVQTQKPTYIFPINITSKKLSRFHQDALNLGLVKWFEPLQMTEIFAPKSFMQMDIIVEKICKLLDS